MKTEIQEAWIDGCEYGGNYLDRESFLAGWEAGDRHAGRSIGELAFIGRQVAVGVAEEDAEAQLSEPQSHAA